jgi:hypothetical protein
MDTDKLSVEVVGFMIMEAWFVIEKQKGGGRVLFFAQKKKMGEVGHVSCYNLNITNWFSYGNFSSVIISAILIR